MVQNEVKFLGNICEIGRGSSPRPINDIRYFEGGTIPWIKIADATKSEKYLYETKEHVNEYGASFSRIMPKGSLIFSASGVSLGKPIILGVEGCIHDGWIYLNNFDKTILSEYLYYFLLTQQKYFLNFSYGAAIQNINTDIMKGMPISLPSTKNQQKIVNILSNYDDLIENNNKRIKILEEMAQKIYKEWFVDFKFPNHETATFKQTDLGEIPSDWEVVLVENLLKRLKAKNKYTQDNVISQGNTIVIDQSTAEFLGFHNNEPDFYANPEKPLIIFGDHTCKMQILVENFSIGPNVIPITSDTIPIAFLYYLIDSLIETKEYKRHWNDLIAKKVILPTNNLTMYYSKIITPIMATINHLKHKNMNLKQTRDILLPRLISGEIDVENMEIV